MHLVFPLHFLTASKLNSTILHTVSYNERFCNLNVFLYCYVVICSLVARTPSIIIASHCFLPQLLNFASHASIHFYKFPCNNTTYKKAKDMLFQNIDLNNTTKIKCKRKYVQMQTCLIRKILVSVDKNAIPLQQPVYLLRLKFCKMDNFLCLVISSKTDFIVCRVSLNSNNNSLKQSSHMPFRHSLRMQYSYNDHLPPKT